MNEDQIWALLEARAAQDGVTEWQRETQAGPLGATAFLARPVVGGYPGVVRAVALVDQGRVYGVPTGASAADFLRDRGLAPWDVEPDELLQLVRWITLGGNLVLAPTPPRLERHDDHTLLYYSERDVMSGDAYPMVARFPLIGRESVEGDEA